jgi:PLP dependent protein
MTDYSESISDRYNRVLDRLHGSIQRAGRPQESVKLLVVTKGQPAEKIIQAYQSGARLFGENYPDETAGKLDQLKDYPGLEIHMIGHLQSRKARIVASSFHTMHSVDRLSIAEKLNRELMEINRKMPVLLEMNVSGEESKQGFAAWDASKWESLIPDISQLISYDTIQIQGLMTMPPLSLDANAVQPYFKKLRELRDYLAVQFPQQNWSELSMGTSADFEMAVLEGATFIRVGTAIMGPRPAKNSSI